MTEPDRLVSLLHELPPPAMRTLRRAALLASAPLPLAAVGSGREPAAGLQPFAQAQLLRLEESPSPSITIGKELHEFLRRPPEPPDLARIKQEAVHALADYFFAFFVWPPDEMRRNAAVLEPHLDHAATIARGLELHDDLARIQHQRALFVSWGGVELKRALGYSQEAVTAFRAAGQPHPGTLALILTELAYLQQSLGRLDAARSSLIEADQLVSSLVGPVGLEPFLVTCQAVALCRASGQESNAVRAAEAATRAAKPLGFAPERIEAHLRSGMTWAHWHLQRYTGL